MDEREWFEDDTLWRDVGPVLFSSERQAHAAEDAEAIADLLEAGEGARVLDLCCGDGMFLTELARLGLRMTGVDRTAAYLDQARERMEQAGVQAELVQADVREFVRPEAFDGAINMFTSFGYFERPEQNLRVLENLFASLKPGARLLMEMMGKELVARDFVSNDWREIDGVKLTEERRVAQDWSVIENRWTIERDGESSVVEFRHWVYSARELSGMLRQAGFAEVEIFGDLWRGPYDHDADTLVALATKR